MMSRHIFMLSIIRGWKPEIVIMEMKTKKSLLVLGTLSALSLFAGATHAADALTAELKVVGELSVPSCTVVATDDGIYDIGKQSATLIKPAAITTLPEIIKTWTVTCDAATFLNITQVDNRIASKSDASALSFGLGNVNGDGKIGYFRAQLRNATVDGTATSLFYANSNVFTAVKATHYLEQGWKIGWAADASTQKSGKVFAVDIAVTPVLASSATMKGPITENTNIDGSVTLNFAYGI